MSEPDPCALNGTDKYAVDRHEDKNAHILQHALWVETVYIPRAKCLAVHEKLRFGKPYPNYQLECWMDENDVC